MLRGFEKRMLAELGYAPSWARCGDWSTGGLAGATSTSRDRGPVPA